MSINFRAHITLAVVFAISLLAYYDGIYINNGELSAAALPFVIIFGVTWGIYILLTIQRNKD